VGSIGFSHLDFVVKRYGHAAAVDIDERTLHRIQEKYGNTVACFSSVSDFLGQANHSFQDFTAVVSNLGPDHAATVKQLLQNGITKIYLEKPISVSIASCNELKTLQVSHRARIVGGFQRRTSGIVEAVRETAEAECGGPPSTIVVHGGALDMSTNGIHWLDFATALFGALPTSVIGIGSKDPINPRRSDLFFWDGVLTWEFPGHRRLSITFDNSSSLSPSISVYSRNGLISIEDDGISVRTRDPASVKSFPAVYKYGPAKRRTRLSATQLGLVDGRKELFDLLEGTSDIDELFSESSDVTAGMLAGLWSLENRKHVELPVDADHPSYKLEWNAS